MERRYVFDYYVLQALSLSERLSDAFQFIPRKIFLVSLFVIPNTPGNTYIRHNGCNSQNEVYERALELLQSIDFDGNYTINQLTISEQKINIEESIFDLLDAAADIARNSYNKNVISTADLLAAFAEISNEEYLEYLMFFIPNYESRPTTQRRFVIPESLSSFLSVVNDKYSSDEKTCRICGRDEETQQLMRILLKTTKRNAILVGEPGVGKTALVEKFTWMVVTGNCIDKFKNSIILSLDVNAIVAGTQYRGSAEQRFMNLISFLKGNPQCILFIDEIHLLLGAGACRDGDLDLANALKPILARGDTQVIGATTLKEYQEYFSRDEALKRRFEKITVKEPSFKDVYPMIRNQVKYLEKAHGVSISKDMVNFIILNAACFNFETHNPDRTLDLVDKALVSAEMARKKSVSKKDVLSNFAINFKKFDIMSVEKKKSTAYHEAGHYIIHRFSDELSEFKTLAVSIMPAEDYLGINVFEIDSDITPSANRKYFIQLLASYLAGRIAEKMYTNELTAGACSDLTKATRVAKDVITKYGLDENFTQDRVFLRDSENPMYTESLITEINKHVDALLADAREYATNLINEKKAYLELLVDALMKNGILSEMEIDKLFTDFENSNS